MDTCGKTNTEFRAEVNEAIAKHDVGLTKVTANFEHLNTTLQNALLELQSLRLPTTSPR